MGWYVQYDGVCDKGTGAPVTRAQTPTVARISTIPQVLFVVKFFVMVSINAAPFVKPKGLGGKNRVLPDSPDAEYNTAMIFRCFVLAAMLPLFALPASAEVSVTASPTGEPSPAHSGTTIIARCDGFDTGGTTSIRLQTDKTMDDNKFYGAKPGVNNNRIVPPTEPKLQQRDRDLGQTFVTGANDCTVESLVLRVGFTDKAVLAGAPGAAVVVQWFEVRGSPVLNDSGTPGFLGTFDRTRTPELDDFLAGETFRSLRVCSPATLPAKLSPGDFLRFRFAGRDAVRLKPHTQYAFVIGFQKRGANRQLALANSYYGSYQPDPKNPLVGHGLRREGGTGRREAPYFAPDLPDDSKKRAAIPPGTLGFPDVCTWRDLYFVVSGRARK